jgi:preprotein translocase subunit SecD
MTLTSRPSLLFSLIAWLAVTGLGVYLLLNVHKYVNFGIDLVGGTYITLEVETDKAIENELVDKMQHIVKKLEEEKRAVPAAPKVVQNSGVLTFASDAQAKEAYDITAADLDTHTFILKQEKNILILALTTSATDTLKHEAVQGNISVLRTRLDAFGVGEINIAAQGERNIIIELPNVDDPEKAKARIGKTALLELKPVYDSASTKEALIERHGGSLPEGTVIIPGKPGSDRHDKFYLVPTYAEVTGRILKNAEYQPAQDELLFKGSPHGVSIVFKLEGGDKFADLTRKQIGSRIAIIIDNIVISDPSVSEEIRGGQARISGNFTKEEAQELASILKSGAFVAPVKYVEERHIGPSLGKESVHNGLKACAIALGLLFLFSIITYKTAGLFAFIVLLYNLLLILFGLASLGATLTLPGIAGMVLTIGMAIDASILIYERIREELAHGSSMRKAVDIGFAGATAVILDANITHFIVSIVLYWLGTGPIQGFASTMIIGILSTLLTGLILLRTIFNVSLDLVGMKTIKI